MDALAKAGTAAPGQDMWFSSVNTTTEAIKRLRNGQLTALAGGHFIAGRGPWSWSMTTIAARLCLRRAGAGTPHVRPAYPDLAHRYQQRFGNGFASLNVRSYSKVLNPKVKRYQFGFEQLL